MPPLIDAIQALLSAPDVAAVKAAIKQYEHVLLTDEADAMLTQNIDNASPDTAPGALDALTNYREILRLCRQNGIDHTFEQLQQAPDEDGESDGESDAESDGDVPPIIEAIQAMLIAPDIDALKAAIQQHAHLLLTGDADAILTQNIDHAPPDAPPALISALRDRREILRMCRQLGIDEAFNRLGPGPDDAPPPVIQAIQDLLTSPDAGAVEHTIRDNAHLLLTEEADQILEQNILNAPPGTPREFIAGLENARQLLQLCREQGIEEAFRLLRASGPASPSEGSPAGPSAAGTSTPPIPAEFEDRVVAGLTGSPKDKMALFSYLDALPDSDPGLHALVEAAKRAVFGGVAHTGGDLNGPYADVWGRIAQRVQAGD